MKRKRPLILVAFLMSLYIGPMILAPSYVSSAMPTEENMIKDFTPAAVAEWYNVSWLYRKNVSITGSTGAGTDYQIRLNVTWDSDMQDDFDDIRFTAYDGVTEWDYWIESYVASTWAVVWVEWRADLGSNSVGWMYYGNAACGTISDGEDTFLFYEDWTVESMSAARWDLVDNNGATSWDATDANHGSILKLEGAAGANSQSYESVYDDISPTSIMFRANIEETLAANQRIRIGSGSPTIFSLAYIDSNAGTHQLTVYDDDGNADHQAMDAGHFGSYHTFEITRDGTNAKLYIDTALDETASCDPDIVSTPATFIAVEDEEKDLYIDWFAVRKFMAGTEPVFSSFGDEDYYRSWHTLPAAQLWFVMPEWNIINTAILKFVTELFTGSLEAWFILLGLVMIPASTLYLVRGGKDGLSNDKVFYFLIIFFFGWALFLGGIMP